MFYRSGKHFYINFVFSSATHIEEKCHKGYIPKGMPNRNQTSFCEDGKWNKPKGLPNFYDVPGEELYMNKLVDKNQEKCVPTCLPGCQNGGTCVKPNECSCAEGFTGKGCAEASPKRCGALPGAVENGYSLYK